MPALPQQNLTLDNDDADSIHSTTSSRQTASSYQIPVILPTFGIQSSKNTSQTPSEVDLPCRKKKDRTRYSRKQLLKQARHQELSTFMSIEKKTLRKIEEEEGPYDYHSGTRDGLFEEVLKDQELRKMWQCFVSLPGEAQEKFVRYLENGKSFSATKKSRSTYVNLKRKRAKIIEEQDSNDSGINETTTKDNIYSHLSEFQQDQLSKLDLDSIPQHLESAQKSYNNIQKKVRQQMKKLKWDRIPIELIKSFEKELIKHFQDESKQSIPLIKMDLSSYERTWCHRICDYYYLKSCSEVDEPGTGKVFVVTNIVKFVQPEILFSQYLTLIMI